MKIQIYDSERIPVVNFHELEIAAIPDNQYFPVNWEFRYDFPDVARDLKKLIRYWMFKLGLRIFYACDVKVEKVQPSSRMSTFIKTVEVDDLLEGIQKKIESRRFNNRQGDGLMVLVGHKQFQQLSDIPMDVAFNFGLKYNYQERISDRRSGVEMYKKGVYVLEVPVYLLPDFDGFAVIPDLSGQIERRLINERYFDFRVTDHRLRKTSGNVD